MLQLQRRKRSLVHRMIPKVSRILGESNYKNNLSQVKQFLEDLGGFLREAMIR